MLSRGSVRSARPWRGGAWPWRGGTWPWRDVLSFGGVRSAGCGGRVGPAWSAVLSASLSALPEHLPKLSYDFVFSTKDFKVGEAGGQCCRS